MSAALFNLNSDLKQLREDGYVVRIEGGNLVMYEVPYINAHREVKTGTIRSTLCLSGDITLKPEPHTVYFEGEFPCHADGTPLISISAGGNVPADLLVSAQHYLSCKPNDNGYTDYFAKMSTYATIISGPAAVLRPGTSPRKVWGPADDGDSVFNYVETASGRAGIGVLTARLADERIAIIGIGGTGSYALDLLAKTPVREIRLIDGDDFLQHNAFRAPGAPTIEQLREMPKKVNYFAAIYSSMHRGIVAHAVELTESTVTLLDGVSFAFLCMDAGGAKRVAVEQLERMGVPFVDVGMGLELSNGSLGGILRVTLSTPEERGFARERIAFEEQNEENVYSSNIQVADLNALNAALAVMKWKKYRGFYRDLEKEHHCSYTTDGNMLLNGIPA
ncbi:ThiF family adenylyltransferase [Zoogloea oleivorans]|uniref:ThiF family adenylyltransferase n=2 Tax=Zoogloea oleivorans TaxID=1552750 RepID=A0A6C2CMK6_9RHOO|nr:ThiF family adenylyltransferase [Zoogloea oleivorans]